MAIEELKNVCAIVKTGKIFKNCLKGTQQHVFPRELKGKKNKKHSILFKVGTTKAQALSAFSIILCFALSNITYKYIQKEIL